MATPSKSFIIKHMNADHQDSLALYLQVYCKVAGRDACSAQLEDISLHDLVIRAKGTRYSVPLSPPMGSLSETRSRVVAMHRECLERRGLSDIRISAYRPPRSLHHITVFAVCLATYVAFSTASNFLPGALFYEVVGLRRVPGFARFCFRIQPILLPLMVGIHVLEASLLAVKRLRRHRVPALSRVWWAWVVSCFIEGFGAFQRFDQMVREQQTKAESGKSR